MKKCKVCEDEKDSSLFYSNARTKDRLSPYCKECHKDKVAKWQKENPERVKALRKNISKDKLKESSKRYRSKNKDKIKQRIKDWKRKNPDKAKAIYERYISKSTTFKERQRARATVNNAVQAGKLAKPSNCVLCGIKTKLEGHHHKGYDEVNWLDVMWVCNPCHRNIKE